MAGVAVRWRHEPALILTALVCPLAGLLLLRLDRRAPLGSDTLVARLSTVAAFVLMLAVWSISIVLWRRAGGFFGIRDTGESVGMFLSSFQVNDFTSFFLQDHAASSDPAALGYYYIHHPNFISRLLAMIGIAAGMTQERLILACLMLSALSLLVGFLGLRRLFGPIAALAAVGFFATSYGVYFTEAGDLLRGLHAVMLWVLVYLMGLEWQAPKAHAPGRNAALALLFVFIASSDWAFFLFCLTFYFMWSLYARRRLDGRHLLAWVALPSALTFIAYFCVIIGYAGFKFFATDLLVTYFGRMGNVLSGPLLGQAWDPDKFLALYRAKHIVMWAADPTPTQLRDVVTGYWQVMLGGNSWVARVLFATFIACAAATLLRASRPRLLRVAVLGALGALVLGFAIAKLALLLIAYLLVRLPRLRAEGAVRRSGEPVRPSARLQDLATWVTVALAATSIVGMLLPDYVSWLWGRGVSPVGLPAAAAFGLICEVLLSLPLYSRELPWLPARLAEARMALARTAAALSISGEAATATRPEEEAGAPPASGRGLPRLGAKSGITAVAVLSALHLASNVELYRQIPPLGPPFAAALRQPEFHGKLFVSNVYDALVWYFTRGTSLITTIVPPDRESTKRFRHLRDGDDEAKYAHPEFFLCDNDPYFAFQRVARVGGKLCQMPSECTCRDVMQEMSKAGDTPVVIGPDFVIMKYHYAK